jgi:hypothetical protein
MNEELTKDIVRDKIDESLEFGWKREPEKSKNINISKLLQKASKSQKGGVGYPEFLITNENHPNLVIVVECKAHIKSHESSDRNKYKDYAVDGVLWYSKYLSKNFDVIAIAVSGEKLEKIKVTNFLVLKNSEPAEISRQFLNPSELFLLYESRNKKKRENYSLSQFTKNLNERLHDEDIKEDKRCLLISGILIALQNQGFKKSFKDLRTTTLLFNSLIDSILDELEAQSDYSEIIKRSFLWMKSHKVLNNDRSFLINLIDEINENFNNFIKDNDYFDFVSSFYVEFFRYASNSKSLGIVLTPPHIAELFNDLAETNKDSIVLDNCCGTGSFLVSALRYMIKKADGNKSKEKEIKEKQIIGIEKEADMFVLALCNMKIHDDGKSNIFFNNCFEYPKLKLPYKPTIGLLNPPFKPPKKQMVNKKEELEFVLNNLQLIVPGGITVALLPMDCVNTQKGEGLLLKQELLSKHTLLGVMSLPDELFYDSDTSTVTCCMVVKAHVPHNENFQTYFGYWKDDGFVKRKWGRVDDKKEWKNRKKLWLDSYFNKKEIKELSILKKIKPEDEWCAEAYMETDYSKLTDEDFSRTIKNFLSYKFINEKNN